MKINHLKYFDNSWTTFHSDWIYSETRLVWSDFLTNDSVHSVHFIEQNTDESVRAVTDLSDLFNELKLITFFITHSKWPNYCYCVILKSLSTYILCEFLYSQSVIISQFGNVLLREVNEIRIALSPQNSPSSVVY